MLSFSFSIPSPITCFHSMTKNITSLRSVSVFQSQVPLHVSIVWQKTSLCCAQFQFFNPKSHSTFPQYDKTLHFAALSFSFSIPSPVTCFHSLTKNITSLHSVSVFQFQVPLHVSNGLQSPQLNPAFHAETTHQIHVWEYSWRGWFDIEYIVHYHYNMHTINFPWTTSHWASKLPLRTPIMSSWAHKFPLST